MSLNDPQWGRRPKNDGPPDLDEIWRNVNRRLNTIFDRKGSNGGEPPNRRGFVMSLTAVSVIVGIIFLIWLASGFYIVNEGWRGVEFRFGRHTITTSPGLRWRWPYPIETVEVVNPSQVKAVEIGYRGKAKSKNLRESLILTEEQNIIDVQFSVQYDLKSPIDYLFYNRDRDEEAVRQVAETSIREIVGKSKMDYVLYEGKEQIALATEKLMQQILDRYKTGINIRRVTIENVQPPEQVQAAFDDAVKANQDRERQINEGQAYANDVIPRARGRAARLLEEATGYQQEVVARALGDASRFDQILIEYVRAPNVTRDRLYLDMMQSVLSTSSKVLVDQKGGNNLLYLPIDRLMQPSPAPPAAPDPAKAALSDSSPVTLDPATRGRESMRRDREIRQ